MRTNDLNTYTNYGSDAYDDDDDDDDDEICRSQPLCNSSMQALTNCSSPYY